MSNTANITFTGHHIDLTDPLRDYTTKRFDRILRHFDHITSIDITFEVEKLSQIAKATVNTSGKRIHADADSEDMYQSVDRLIEKLERQLSEHFRH